MKINKKYKGFNVTLRFFRRQIHRRRVIDQKKKFIKNIGVLVVQKTGCRVCDSRRTI